jgi:hypothetical protein
LSTSTKSERAAKKAAELDEHSANKRAKEELRATGQVKVQAATS